MFEEIFSQLGVVGIPLIILSVITLAIIIERLVTFTLQPNIGKARVRQLFTELQDFRAGQDLCSCQGKADSFCQQKHCLHQGVGVLLSHANCEKSVREEVASIWLLKHRQRMHAGLRVLMLIGTIAPMVGLLGTVLGMITMFKGMAVTTGPVTPAVLADGLFAAMYTTAYGLIIAIPALGASQGLTLWANHYIGRLEFVLNHVNLLIQGVDSGDGSFSQPKKGDNSKNVKSITPREPIAA
ncbi:MotA/TolQ/ExbB proton channel family protein [Parendozoicomonas haliclonae]|uniref:Biopolymer transport protein ExbB n=1 Tax=Parendozoicomonas haliclonae TaxID=1960125 RepID=A0A1X7AKW7_9GAMM|nr:MotA/TolQ/ExbB proton channel family protein [Parendozoicomonas haliclonae]SMA44900.1 Biopolymer transport protein ExbB [Parendozoicomonas haliclonae]